MAELIRGLDPDRIRARLDEVRAEIDAAATRAGRDGTAVELLAACKYVPVEEMGALVAAGVTLVGENRAQDLVAKHAALGDALTWDFIGHLQSRKVRDVLPRVRAIHSVSSDSVLAQIARRAGASAAPELLIEVNLSGEPSKSGIEPSQLDPFIERCPLPVTGLMTMPPLADEPEANRPYFARLRELAEARGLPRLSMGTSQDFGVAVEEGATIVRIGTRLYA